MKKSIVLVFSFVLLVLSASADQYVHGYTKSNGTYVQGHMRSNANSTTSDNFSTKGNINPYTGKMGTKNEYPQQQNNNPYGSSYNYQKNSNSGY